MIDFFLVVIHWVKLCQSCCCPGFDCMASEAKNTRIQSPGWNCSLPLPSPHYVHSFARGIDFTSDTLFDLTKKKKTQTLLFFAAQKSISLKSCEYIFEREKNEWDRAGEKQTQNGQTNKLNTLFGSKRDEAAVALALALAIKINRQTTSGSL